MGTPVAEEMGCGVRRKRTMQTREEEEKQLLSLKGQLAYWSPSQKTRTVTDLQERNRQTLGLVRMCVT
jgi:hypothetical protein